MNPSIINQSPYLRTSRLFPEEIGQLCMELNRAYTDISNTTNVRTIGIYPTNKSAITGETWYFTPRRQQTLRQIYPFTATTAINHNIQGLQPGQITKAYGTWTDGTNSYGTIFAGLAGIAGQLTFYVTATQIVFVGPAVGLVSGFIVLEWLSAV